MAQSDRSAPPATETGAAVTVDIADPAVASLADVPLTHSDDLHRARELSRIGCWSIALASQELRACAFCKTLYGRSRVDPFTLADFMGAVHPDDREEQASALDAAARHGEWLNVEHRLMLPDGALRWVAVRGHAVDDGPPIGARLIGTVYDCTERKERDIDRAIRADELEHRIKNCFALVKATVAQTVRSAASFEEFGPLVDRRLSALAAANDLLTRESTAVMTMQEMLLRVLGPFGYPDRCQISGGGPDVILPARVVALLVLTLHELATNACKFGALSVAGGTVQIGWIVDGDGATHRLHLTWEERGGPPITSPPRAGFGTRLIGRCLGSDAGGLTAIDFRETGVVFSAELPLRASEAPT